MKNLLKLIADNLIFICSIISIFISYSIFYQPLMLSTSGSLILLFFIFFFKFYSSNENINVINNLYCLIITIAFYTIVNILLYIYEDIDEIIINKHGYNLFYCILILLNIIILCKYYKIKKHFKKNNIELIIINKPFINLLRKIIKISIIIETTWLLILIVIIEFIGKKDFKTEFFNTDMNILSLICFIPGLILVISLIIIMIYFSLKIILGIIKILTKEKSKLTYFYFIPLMFSLIIKPFSILIGEKNQFIYILFMLFISLINCIRLFLKYDYILNIKLMSINILYCLAFYPVTRIKISINMYLCLISIILFMSFNIQEIIIYFRIKHYRIKIYSFFVIALTCILFTLNTIKIFFTPFNYIFYLFMYIMLIIFIITTEKAMNKNNEQ